PQLVSYTGQKSLDVVMAPDAVQAEQVVVTGYYSRKMESFTGSATTFSKKELKSAGNSNVLQSLAVLDPAFRIVENNLAGSNPNALPDMEIRGKTSVVGLKEKYGSDPNQPLFILDGFEVPIQTITDLSMERVESVTILKDAASTAIYGSRAANGVVVVETKRPEPGKLTFTYTGNFNVSAPILNDYNLMNAAEKLEFERQAGVYRPLPHATNDPNNQIMLDQTYNDRLHRVASGVDTYWLSEPVRVGFSHKHNVYIEGGDQAMRYGAGLSYNNTQGVMFGSKRENLSGNVDLLYRKGKFSFSNKLTIDNLNANNPSVGFSQYAVASPYYTKYGTDGSVNRLLEYANPNNSAMSNIANPIYESRLNNRNQNKNFGIRDNFQAEWRILESLRLRGRFGLSKSVESNEIFLSPEHFSFNGINDPALRGSYNKNTTDKFSYDGDITLSWGQVVGEKHRFNFVGGWTFNESSYTSEGFAAVGFPSNEITNPSFANQYPLNGKPSYSHNLNRSTSFFGNFGYSYDERYMVDANVRVDGSSVFGSDKMFTTTWSVGLSWNLHNEAFLKDSKVVDLLKIRASIGNPGNLNFSGYNSYTTYVYNTTYNNYMGLGAIVAKWGNPNLLWQKTLDLNVGIDVALLGNRLKIIADVYQKLTDPLLIVATLPSSTGMGSYTTNLGQQLTQGLSASIYFSPIYHPERNINWTISLNGRIQRSQYNKIGSALDQMNQEQRGTSLTRYYDGASPTAIWAVRSAGIDPMTGREVFIKKDGEHTFEYDYADEVVVGDTQPKLEGVLGTTLYIKGFSFSAYFRYKFGAQVFNTALYGKVENVTRGNWTNNLDKRALYDRWQKPGDIAMFKSISLVDEIDPPSSRFVQNENTISGESFSFGYQFTNQAWLKKISCRTLSLTAYANDLFRISTVKAERGIDYPYAKSFSFSLSITF
ncbi:MAG: SusC/RagA family TonB-linked outer membrane protein, partial [Mucinivorans sp.]